MILLQYDSDNLPYEKVGKSEPVCIADEVPFDIPESWEWVRLSKIVYSRGQMTPADDFCYIDIGSIDNKNQKLSDEENIIAADKAPSRARKIVDIGDILYSTVRPYLHNMCVVDRSFSHQPIASTGFAVLTCHTGFYNEFLFYYLMSPDFDAYANDTDNAKGIAYPAITDNKLYQALIPVPPEAEQKRIAEKIKEALPYVATYRVAYSEAESLNNAFPDRLKKSILQEAVQGKLVPQDPADEPASVLLERIRAEKEQLIKAGKIKRDKHESVIFRRDNSHYEKLDGIDRCIDDEIPFEIPESWVWVRFFSVIDIATNLVRPDTYADYMHIAPDNIEKATGFLLECHTVQQDKVVSPNHLFYKGQIIYSKIRPLLRKAVIAPFDGLCSADMYPLNTSVNKEYLLRYILSDTFNLQVATTMSSRIKMPKINQDELSKILIPIPPIQEQEHIISRIKELFDKITLI